MRYLFTLSFLLFLTIVTAACQSQPPTPAPTYTPYPTDTPYPTYTPQPPPISDRPSVPSEEVENLVWPMGPRDDVIPAEDAGAFINERVTVEGTVVRTHNAGNVVFLNFTQDYKNGFTAVIFADDWNKFPASPENLFYGKLVRVEGVVQDYQGTPEIIISDPWQIEVALTLGQPVVSECNCQNPPTAITQPAAATSIPTDTPAAETFAPPAVESQGQMVSWQEAANFVGQTITVEGQIVNTYNSDKVIFLNFDQDYRNSFKVVIFPDAWSLFPDSPDIYFQDKMVRVTGSIKIYQNSPEIIVDQPDQIEIME